LRDNARTHPRNRGGSAGYCTATNSGERRLPVRQSDGLVPRRDQPAFAEPRRGEHRFWFHEYFHGDTGAGLGASHQTGWTGLIAKLIQQQGEFGTIIGRDS
jgi:hypothetical protein